MMAMVIISSFEQELSQVLALASFIPIVMGMGGNIGTQSSTIVVRGLATGRINIPDFWPVIFKELAVALILSWKLTLIFAATAPVVALIVTWASTPSRATSVSPAAPVGQAVLEVQELLKQGYAELRRGKPALHRVYGEEIALLVAVPYAFSLAGLGLWANLGDRFDIRAALAALGFGAGGLLFYLGLSASSMAVVLACFAATMFLVSAFNACEFAMVQRIVPLSKEAPAMGVYNGLTTIIGGSMGPFIVSPIIGAEGPVWIISVIALGNAALLFLAWRIIRY